MMITQCSPIVRIALLPLLLAIGPFFSAAEEADSHTPDDLTPSILTPDMIFAKEREKLRSLTTGDYPFRRGIFQEDIVVKSKTVRLQSGKKVTLVWGRPKSAQLAPAVFLIDIEAASLNTAPTRRFYSSNNRKAQKEKESRYLTTSPFGSNLLGQGFIVAYVIGKDLESIRSARIPDWVKMFDHVRDLKEVDENSYFLMSTKEYANLSIYLAGNYSFSGFFLEEPQYMLFSRQTHENVIQQSDQLTPEEIWDRTDPSRREFYQKTFSSIYSPIILVRSEDSPAHDFTEKTLIHTLRNSNNHFETIYLEHGARTLQSHGTSSGVLEIEPQVIYNPKSVATWLEGMITYMKVNSDTLPIELKKRAIAF